MTNALLLRRFEGYFAHADKAHSVLQPGDRGVACANVRRALCILGHLEPTFQISDTADDLDEALWCAVRKFQETQRGARVDGLVGPVTRQLLVSALLERDSVTVFQGRLTRPDPVSQVFLSYAWRDASKVDKVDQWLRDNGVRVIRDQTDFVPGETIDDSIRDAVARSDKVVAVYSENSKGKEWPALEAFVAGELEAALGTKLLVYVRLDNTPLPERTAGRLHIDAAERTLRSVGEKLLHAITGEGANLSRYDYDENAPL